MTTKQNAAVKRLDDGQKLIWTFIADKMSGHNAEAGAEAFYEGRTSSKLCKPKVKP